MKKILFISAANDLNTHALDFACYLCNLTHSRLTGIFIEDSGTFTGSQEIPLYASVTAGDSGDAASGKTYVQKNGIIFKEACTAREAVCELRTPQGITQEDVLQLSRYADIIVTDADISFSGTPSILPSHFMRDIMAQAECPVITAPFRFEGINEIIFCYDGSASSMYAIRQFTYLLPELCDLDVIVLSILPPDVSPGPATADLDAWMQAHYTHYHFTTLEDDHPRSRLLEYLLSRKHSIIVMGAFGRGKLSDFVSPSHALPVLKFSNQPVFVTHY